MKEIACFILENAKGEFLLYLRDNKPNIPFPLYWDLFGGHLGKGVLDIKCGVNSGGSPELKNPPDQPAGFTNYTTDFISLILTDDCIRRKRPRQDLLHNNSGRNPGSF